MRRAKKLSEELTLKKEEKPKVFVVKVAGKWVEDGEFHTLVIRSSCKRRANS